MIPFIWLYSQKTEGGQRGAIITTSESESFPGGTGLAAALTPLCWPWLWGHGDHLGDVVITKDTLIGSVSFDYLNSHSVFY